MVSNRFVFNIIFFNTIPIAINDFIWVICFSKMICVTYYI